MTIADAAEAVLRATGRPMTAREIYAEIVRAHLFVFGAKDPVSVVAKALRKKSSGSTADTGNAVFTAEERHTYGLAEWRQQK